MVSAKSEFPWEEAWQVWVELRGQLSPVCRKIVPAGSLRRRQPVVHDLDVVAIPLLAVQYDLFGNPTKEYSLLDLKLAELGVDFVKDGDKIKTFIFRGMPVDLYVCDEDSFATTFLIRTGSREHNRWLAQLSMRKGFRLKVNGTGLVKMGTGQRIAWRSEREIFRALGLPWIPPKDRDVPEEANEGQPYEHYGVSLY